MTLHVAQVPDPPAGVDWSTMVPGQYLYNVTGVTGTIGAGTGPATIAHDASGHGLDGTYHTFFQPLTFVPGLVAGDLALFTGPNANAAVAGVAVPQGVLDWHNPFTFALWIQETPTLNNPWLIYQSRDNANAGVVTILWDEFGGNMIRVGGDVAVVWDSPPNTLPDDGSVHFLVLRWDGAALTLYMDNVAVPWAVTGAPNAFTHFTFGGGLAFDGIGNVAGAGVMDELSLFNYDIGAPAIGAMFAAAAVSFPAYEAAVLALGPVAYYHLDDVAVGGGRQVGLSITDGTNEVALLGAGFPTPAGTGPFPYSWLPDATSSTQSANGATTTIAIPRLILPAGYTIGTFTPDIQSGDQWSDVSVWWDDDVQLATQPIRPYEYPPGALLQYHQIGTAP